MNPFARTTLVVELQAGGTHRLSVLAHLSYDAAAPFVVTAVFSHRGRVLTRWQLDREMLGEGLRRPVGIGDVRLRPVDAGTRDELRMDFLGDVRSAGGRHHAVVFAWMPAVAAFLRETWRLVPPGREEVRVDDFLAQLSAGA